MDDTITAQLQSQVTSYNLKYADGLLEKARVAMQEHLQRRAVLALWLVAVIFVRPSQPQPYGRPAPKKNIKKLKINFLRATRTGERLSDRLTDDEERKHWACATCSAPLAGRFERVIQAT